MFVTSGRANGTHLDSIGLLAIAASPSSASSVCDAPVCLEGDITVMRCNESHTTLCAPCRTRRQDGRIACHRDAASAAACARHLGGEWCQPVHGRRLDDTKPTTTASPASISTTTAVTDKNDQVVSSKTTLYTIACVGMCCLVLALYGVLRWVNRTRPDDGDDVLDDDGDEDVTHGDAKTHHIAPHEVITTDKIANSGLLIGGPPPETLSMPPLEAMSEPRKDSIESSRQPSFDHKATYSMFHTVGRISLQQLSSHQHGDVASSALDSGIVFIMEESEVWEEDEENPDRASSRSTPRSHKA
ncbi:Aste57867_11475 [Aphanomyces stellatus]|uniref:Aste57867_11475 protein n=1 Tax=Aphanomyces stellatus TaxID=120398 RepID=A0A485KTN6_9STRA|nr:hypothetical protein As57867_011432 [Aphanomyces stellatus]VFT88336.1 Aste57867_11475 [Aphanomyces stellatus]